jgi:hypothetical protein
MGNLSYIERMHETLERAEKAEAALESERAQREAAERRVDGTLTLLELAALERDSLHASIERVREGFPHLEASWPVGGWPGREVDPGWPICTRCRLEELLKP